jgi:hypothetical protein
MSLEVEVCYASDAIKPIVKMQLIDPTTIPSTCFSYTELGARCPMAISRPSIAGFRSQLWILVNQALLRVDSFKDSTWKMGLYSLGFDDGVLKSPQ